VVNLEELASRPQAPYDAEPFHTWNCPDGTTWTAFYRTSSGFMLRFPGFADFEVSTDGRRVTCAPAPDVSNATTEHLYLNQILPLALSKLGKLVFHASAVEVVGGAIAFLAASGCGKSTLAANFAVNGHRFLTDDGLVLDHDDAGYVVQPSHPSLRLWRDSQERLFAGEARTAAALDYTTKARLLAGDGLAHCDQARTLLTAYFLGNDSAEDITLQRLTEAETLLEWAKNSFLLDVEDKSLVGAHFERIAALANTVPCYRLDYPRRYDHLSRVIAAVAAHASTLSSSA
jgi:hypothetical protein